MAVIREQRQFKIGPIGIARASRAGVITGEAVARAGAQAQEYFFRRAVEDAQKAGVEAAGSLEASEVVALDPETGRPKLYEGPKGFGRYAQQAYQKVLLQRFEQEIGIEIEDKSKEFAIKFSKSPEGFNQAMSDYIAEMSNVQESTIFKQEIQRIGKAVQTSKYRALQLQAQARQERNDALGYQASRAENFSSIEDAYAVGNFGLGEQYIQSGTQLDSDNVAAGTILSNATAGNDRERKLAKARGLLRLGLYRAVKENPNNDIILSEALNAIDSGDISQMPEGLFPELSKLLSGEGATFREEIAQFGTELITDGINQVRLNRQIQMRDRAVAAMELQFDTATDYFDILGGSIASSIGRMDAYVDDYIADQASAREALRSGASQEEVESYTTVSSAKLNSATTAMTRRMFAGLDSVKDVISVQNYIKNPTDANAAKIPPASAAIATRLLAVAERTGQTGLIDAIDKYAESISDEVRFAEQQRQEQETTNFNAYLKDEGFASLGSAATVEDLIAAQNEITAQLKSKADITPAVGERFTSIISNKTSESYFRLAFGTAKTPQVISQMQQYARNPNYDATLLTDSQKQMIDGARNSSDDAGNYTTNLNEYSRRANERYADKIQQVKDTKVLRDVLDGNVIASDLSETERFKIDMQLNIPSDYYSNPKYNSDEFAEINGLVQRVSAAYWPQAQYDTIKSFLAGRITDTAEMERVLSTYKKASFYITDNGFEKKSGGLSGLNSDQIALMDAAFSYAQIQNDPQAIMQHLNNIQRSMSDKNLSADMNAFYTRKADEKSNRVRTENVEQYISVNYPEALTNPNLFNRLVSQAKVHYFESISEERTDKRFDEIDDVLQGVIDKEFVEDDRIITPAGSNKTMYPLSTTVKGYEDKFMDYVRSSMKQMSTNKDLDWDTVDFKLMPVGFNDEDRGMTYGVVLVDEAGTRNLQEVEVYATEVDPSAVMPAFFSTKEPIFSAYKLQAKKSAEDAATTEGERRKAAMQAMGEGFAEISVAVTGPKEGQESDLLFINPLGGNTFMPTDTFMKEKKEFFQKKKQKIGDAQATVKPFIDSNKYSSLFEKLPSSYGANYSKLAESSPTSIPRIIKFILDEVSYMNDPLASELEVDLKSMLELLGE